MPKPRDAAALRDLGRILSELRDNAGLTQEDLADLDCDRATVSRIENGYYRPSPYMITNLLGKVGGNTVPWGFFLTGISGVEACECVISLHDNLRISEIMGHIAAIRNDKDDNSDDFCSENNIQNLLLLIEKYKSLPDINTLRSEAFIDFLLNCYLNYSDLDPSERINLAYRIIERRHQTDSIKDIKVNYLLCDDIDRMILNEIALLYMDMAEYDTATDIECSLLKYQFRLRLVSPKYHRALVIYNYNISLCALLSENIIRAREYAMAALNALCHGGEMPLFLYLCGLFTRILKALNMETEYHLFYTALEAMCVIFEKYTDFKRSIDDLMLQKRGLSDF